MSNYGPKRFTLIFFTVIHIAVAPVASGNEFYPPDAWGPFSIGYRRLPAESRGRSIWIDVWYPADQTDANGEPASYQLLPGDPFAFPADRALTSLSISKDGTFPMVVFSHGHLGFSGDASDMSEMLASHGFVVAAPNHAGGAVQDTFTYQDSMLRAVDALRIQDVRVTVDEIIEGNLNPDSPFFGSVDSERIGAAGHSLGGRTAFQSQRRDPRIDSLFLISPSLLFAETGRVNEKVPTFLLGGTRDSVFEQSDFARLEREEVEPRFMAEIDAADHASYIDICDVLDFSAANDAPREVLASWESVDRRHRTCSAEAIDNQEGIDLTNLYAVAFFKTFLQQDDRFARYLTDEYAEAHELPINVEAAGLVVPDQTVQAGDANQDLSFDQLDLVQVQITAKYLTGQTATWGEGDWNGAPGGSVGNPPTGDGVFNQLDIVAAQQANIYLSGPYSAVGPSGQADDGQTSVVYNPRTGEIAVDVPAGIELTSVNIDSATGIFTGEPAQHILGGFDHDSVHNIFHATFGENFGSLSFGNVAQPGLSKDFILNDLTMIGSSAGGGDLGDVDLIYVPEPSGVVLLVVAALALPASCRRRVLFV